MYICLYALLAPTDKRMHENLGKHLCEHYFIGICEIFLDKIANKMNIGGNRKSSKGLFCPHCTKDNTSEQYERGVAFLGKCGRHMRASSATVRM